jgi:anti-anti-sigma factor
MHLWLTRPTREGVVRLALAGEVDLATSGALRAVIRDSLHDERVTELIVDLGQVTFLDCAGISALVAGYHTATERNQNYAVVNARRRVRRVLDLTGVRVTLSGRQDRSPPAQPLTRSR